jgi:hypothetical protein
MEQEIKRVPDCFLVLRPAAIGIDRVLPFHEMHQLFAALAQVLVPHYRRRHGSNTSRFRGTRSLRRAIGETYGVSWMGAFVRVDCDLVLEFQRHVAGVDVERAAREIAHPALSTLFVINPDVPQRVKPGTFRRANKIR